MARLESDLGARLIQRSTRRLTLTEIGEQVFAETQRIDGALANIEQLTEQHQTEVNGRLRVTCPRPLGQRYLVPLLVEITQRHPGVQVVLSVDDRLVDQIAEHVDVAIPAALAGIEDGKFRCVSARAAVCLIDRIVAKESACECVHAPGASPTFNNGASRDWAPERTPP